MTEQEVLQTFREAGALLEGHFLYASGRHGRQFLQASRVLQFPEKTAALCSAMGASFAGANVDIVCGPATGGIILAHETAKSLGVCSIFSEKEPDGSMAVKRGFHIPKRARVLVVEDVITTGGSVIKTIQHLVSRNAIIVGVAVLVDRSVFRLPL